MIEEQILQTLDDRVKDDRLHFQVIIQEQILYLYINRDTEEYLDYSKLTSTIEAAIAELAELNLSAMELYSRVLGETEPDWHASVELVAKVKRMDKAIANAESLLYEVGEELDDPPQNKSDLNLESTASVENNNIDNSDIDRGISDDRLSINDDEPQIKSTEDSLPKAEDFGQYCFIRNQGLLTADIVAPQKNIAQLINTFARFETSIKRSQLPLLERYFQSDREQDVSSFELEIQSWWTDIYALDSNSKRKLAIWLSRYCLDPESAIATIENVFVAQAAARKSAEESSRQQAKEEREARNNAYLESLNSSNQANSGQSRSQTKRSAKSKPSLGSWTAYILAIFILRLASKLLAGDFSNSYESTAQNKNGSVNTEISSQPHKSQSSRAKELIKLGTKKYHQQDFESALADFTKAIELNSDEGDADGSLAGSYNFRGLVLQKLNDYYRAIDDGTKAIELSPYKSEYYANRGLAYLGARDYQAAIADQTHAIKLKPKESYWYYYRGKAYHEAGDYDKALADLDLAIALNYFTIEAYEQRYYTHRALGNVEKAEADYQKAKYFGQDPQQ